jgi:hypothetical protein
MRFEPCRPGWVPTLALFVDNHGHGVNCCLRPGAWEENRTPDLRIAKLGDVTAAPCRTEPQLGQPVGSGSQGWTLTQHVAGRGPIPVLHNDDGGELMWSLTTWYSVGP